MKTSFGWIVTSLMLVVFGYYLWMHLRTSADAAEINGAPLIEQARKAQQASTEAQDSRPTVTLSGPLAKFISHGTASKPGDIETITYGPVTADHVGGSVVGTSLPILNDKFRVSRTVDLPFEVPAHATTPQLRGTFRSFIQPAGKPTSDTQADLEFRVLNDQEFTNFLNGQPSEALFAAEVTHNQEVNLTLPPSLNRPARYHMVFMNASHSTTKVVQADFQVDF